MVPKAGELQFMWSLAGELQLMRPDQIEPSLESSVENSSVIENFGNSPVVWAGYLSSAGARSAPAEGSSPAQTSGEFSKFYGFKGNFTGFRAFDLWFQLLKTGISSIQQNLR